MTPISRLGHLALILSLVTGCEERATTEDVIPPIPDDSYVQVMAELTRLRRRPPTARGKIERDRLADSVRTEVLLRHGVTAIEIVAFSDVVGSDPTRMQLLAERIATLADSLDADSVRADSIRADSAAPAARFDRLDAEAGMDTLDAVADRVSKYGTKVQGGDPKPSLAEPSFVIPSFTFSILVIPSLTIPSLTIPGFTIPADSGPRIEPTAVDDTVSEVEAAPPTDSAVTRPRPGSGRRPARRPIQTPDPDSTPDQSSHVAPADDTGAV